MSERPKEADCKSAGKRLRRFESFSRHADVPEASVSQSIEAGELPACCEAAHQEFPNVKLDAPLAQSVERFHGKEEVFGSNPERGSACRPLADTMRQENCRRASRAGGDFSEPQRSAVEAGL